MDSEQRTILVQTGSRPLGFCNKAPNEDGDDGDGSDDAMLVDHGFPWAYGMTVNRPSDLLSQTSLIIGAKGRSGHMIAYSPRRYECMLAVQQLAWLD